MCQYVYRSDSYPVEGVRENWEGNTVFTYLDAFCRPEYFAEFLPEYSDLDELKAHYQRGGLGDMKVKRFLNNVLGPEFEPIRKFTKRIQ